LGGSRDNSHSLVPITGKYQFKHDIGLG